MGVSGERIVAVGEVGPAREEIDARGKLVLPGVVDMHTHISQGGLEDVASGTRAAAAGGVTTVLTFAQQQPGGSLIDAARRATAAATGASVDFAFHVIVTDPSERAISELPELVAEGFAGIKIFMVMPAFAERTADFVRIWRAAGEAGAVTAVHAEDHALIASRTAELHAAGRTGVAHFPDSRPVAAEETAVRAAVAHAQETGALTYLVHLSSRAAVDALRDARARRIPIAGETRPIYLYVTREVFDRADGAIWVGQPPLRERDDVAALWEALADGTLATVGTDHFPHLRSRKLDPAHTFDRVPPGMANLQTLLPMLYSEGVRRGRITVRRLVEVLAHTPAQLAGLAARKGTIAVGHDADLVVLDPELRRTVRSSDLVSNADHDPFDGWEVTGWPVTVLCRGRVVHRHGERVDAAGHGRRLARAPVRA